MPSELGTSFDPYHTVAPPVKLDPLEEDDTIKLPPKGSPSASSFLSWMTRPSFPTKDVSYSPSVAPTTSPTTVYYSSSAPSGSTSECPWTPSPPIGNSPYASIAPGPRVVLSTKLQFHFRRVQLGLRYICRSSDIISDASWACGSLMLARNAEPVKVLAKKILRAGTEEEEYTRSVALFTRQLFDQFRRVMSDETRPAAERDIAEQRFAYLIRLIDSMVWQGFMVVWGEVDMDDPMLRDGLELLDGHHAERERTHLLDTTTFVGDLFAVGALSATTICSLVRWLAGRTTTLTHCRGLHLLLSRMTIPGTQTLGEPFLEELQQTLVESTMHEPLFIENMDARRWLQEISDLMIRIAKVGSCEIAWSPLDVHVQSPSLKWGKISSMLSNGPEVFSRPKPPSRIASLLDILNRRSQ